jgi:hypothetical protein
MLHLHECANPARAESATELLHSIGDSTAVEPLHSAADPAAAEPLQSVDDSDAVADAPTETSCNINESYNNII